MLGDFSQVATSKQESDFTNPVSRLEDSKILTQ